MLPSPHLKRTLVTLTQVNLSFDIVLNYCNSLNFTPFRNGLYFIHLQIYWFFTEIQSCIKKYDNEKNNLANTKFNLKLTITFNSFITKFNGCNDHEVKFQKIKLYFSGGGKNNQEINSLIFQEIKSFIISSIFSGNRKSKEHYFQLSI